MASDRGIGALLLVAGILGIVIYAWLLISPYDILILKMTAGIAVVAIFGIFAWIGYTMMTTPSMPAMAGTPSPEPDSKEKMASNKED